MRDFAKIFLVVLIAVIVVFSLGATRSYKSSKYAWLGIMGQSVDEDLAEAFDLAVDQGAIVNEVLDDSPAEEAGLEDGDIIVEFDGEKIRDYDDLLDGIEDRKPGDEVAVTVNRNGREKKLEIILEGRPRGHRIDRWGFWDRHNVVRVPALPALPAIPAIPPIPPIPPIPAIPDMPRMSASDHIYIYDEDYCDVFIGVALTDLNEQLGEYFGVKGGRGALVTEVKEDSPAEAAGIKAGDVIIRADGEKIYDHRDVMDIVGDADEGDKLTLVIIRDKAETTVEVEVSERDRDSRRRRYRWVSPDIDINIPHTRGLHHGVYFDEWSDFLDSEEFEEDMEEFREEMEELREELEELSLEHNEDLLEQLEELEEELEDIEDHLD